MIRFSGSNNISWHHCTVHRVWSQINYVKCCVFIWSWWTFFFHAHGEAKWNIYDTSVTLLFATHAAKKQNTQNCGSNKYPHNCYSFLTTSVIKKNDDQCCCCEIKWPWNASKSPITLLLQVCIRWIDWDPSHLSLSASGQFVMANLYYKKEKCSLEVPAFNLKQSLAEKNYRWKQMTWHTYVKEYTCLIMR